MVSFWHGLYAWCFTLKTAQFKMTELSCSIYATKYVNTSKCKIRTWGHVHLITPPAIISAWSDVAFNFILVYRLWKQLCECYLPQVALSRTQQLKRRHSYRNIWWFRITFFDAPLYIPAFSKHILKVQSACVSFSSSSGFHYDLRSARSNVFYCTELRNEFSSASLHLALICTYHHFDRMRFEFLI